MMDDGFPSSIAQINTLRAIKSSWGGGGEPGHGSSRASWIKCRDSVVAGAAVVAINRRCGFEASKEEKSQLKQRALRCLLETGRPESPRTHTAKAKKHDEVAPIFGQQIRAAQAYP